MNNSSFSYIDSTQALSVICEKIKGSDYLAIDTEFQRETTYYPIPALIQLHARNEIFLIDPAAVEEFSPLVELFDDHTITKIMHSCTEDLEVFMQLFQTVPSPLFDTQVAAALCGLGFSTSYSKLVEVISGETLDKSETRSNWLQRPLTVSQCQYAADDVRLLPQIYDELRARLQQSGRNRWCEQECQRMLATGKTEIDPELSYLRFKSAWRLDEQQLLTLRSLSAWRERLARETDVPRGRIISDAVLFELAQSKISTLADMQPIKGIGSYTLRKYGKVILAIIDRAKTEEAKPIALLPNKKLREYRELIKLMQATAQEVASLEALPVEIIGRKRDLEEYLVDKESSLIQSSWRAELIAEKLDQLIKNSNY